MASKIPLKKVVQDIVPSEKRSIRNIPIERNFDEPPLRIKANRVRPINAKVEEIKEPEEIRGEIKEKKPEMALPIMMRSQPKPPPKKSNGGKKAILSFVIVFICTAVIGIAVSLLYSKAVVTVTLKTVAVDIDGTFTAKKSEISNQLSNQSSAQFSALASNDLSYDTISYSDEIVKSVRATSGPLIETKAKGTMTIFSNSTSSQTLVAGTRLSSPDGLIFRTSASIIIPAKKTTSGSINVTVIADKAGAEYNMKASSNDNFLIVAYKGTDKYEKFYGHLKTDTVGGFSGNKMVVDSEAQKDSVKEAEDSLKAQLTAKLKNSLPKGYVLYDNAYFFEYDVSEPVMKDSNMADIKVKATGYGLIFQNDNLLKFMAGKEIQKFPSSTYDIKGMENLDFKISNLKDFSIKKGTPVIFNIKGNISIVGTFPPDKLKNDLKGITLTDSNKVFANYPAISNAHTLLTPFWMRSFPKSTENITIEYKDSH